MLDLGSAEFVLAVPSLPESELKRLSTSLFDSWEEFVDQAVSLPDYSLTLQVEEGSVRGIAKIAALLGTVYIGIGNYGDFISGVKTISEQISATNDYLALQATRTFSCPQPGATSKNRGGALASLRRLFMRVQKGELSPEEAMRRAERLLGDESNSSPKFMRSLESAFQNCLRFHEQQPLVFPDQFDGLESLSHDSPRTPRSPGQHTVLGPPLQLRVEVWRESKKKRKHTRVVKL